MTFARTAVLLGCLVSLLFCLGLGWGPSSVLLSPARVALLGLTAAGLIWPILVLRIAGRGRRTEGSADAPRPSA
jgi:hypothetical protein